MEEKQFEYTYVSPTEKEKRKIERIRRQYQTEPVENGVVERIQRLDKRVKNTATAWGLTLGIVGCLIFGTGMTMVLEWAILIGGIAVSAIGCLPMCLAYPAYTFFLERGKKKYGEEILRLSDEILQ